jgi:hypothetical protein
MKLIAHPSAGIICPATRLTRTWLRLRNVGLLSVVREVKMEIPVYIFEEW